MYKYFIHIFGHLGLKTTNIPARYGDEIYFVVNWHLLLRYPVLKF